jgi:thymidylate kinase
MESKGDRFLEDVSKAYYQATRRRGHEYTLIDANGLIGEVQQRIWSQVEPLLPKQRGKRK